MVGKGYDDIYSFRNKNILELNHKIENELNTIQIDIFEYAIDHYELEIEEYLEKCYRNLALTPELKDMLHFFTTTWLVTCVEIEGNTIIAEYIDRYSGSYKGKRIKSLLQDWKEAQSSVSIIQDYQDQYVTVKDILTKETYKIKLFDEEATVQPGGILLGTILPAGETALFFTTYVEMPANISDSLANAVLTLYENSQEQDKHTFISKNYPEVLALFFFGPSDVSVEGLDWNNTKQKEVALLFIDFMMEFDGDAAVTDMGVHLWFLYCQQKNPSIKKPMIYVAALVYLINHHLSTAEIITQKELALEFGVSKSSISSKVTELENILLQELKAMHSTVTANEGEFLEERYDFISEAVWEEELEEGLLDRKDYFPDNKNKVIPLKLVSKHFDKR
ncbi:MAG: hypothetical protein ABF649_19005 [Bacillus sp. (in: firmicutes)]